MAIVYLDRKTVAELWDTPGTHRDTVLKGFTFKVFEDASGALQRRFVFQYRVGKQQRKPNICHATKVNVDQARKKAEKLFAQITLGIDPAGDKQTAATALTLRAGLEKYIEMKEDEVRQGLYRPSSFRITKLYLLGQQYFGPLHRLSINAVTKQAVAERLHEIGRASSDATRGRARAQLAAAFTRLMQAERPERDRVLSSHELARIWRASENAGEYGKIVRLLILCGARRQEIGSLSWSWIDTEQWTTMTIPGTRTKNGRELVLPITSLMRKIIESVPRMVDRDHLFGVRAGGFTSWQRYSLDHGITKPWRVHDIRRSVATGMADLGIQPHVIEAVLNHVGGHKAGVAGLYNKATYKREMKTALAMWSDHIASITTGSARKVVPGPGYKQAN
jgi:integrase